MIITTRKFYCDACGKEITRDYQALISVLEFDEYGTPETVGRDFCKDCTISFKEWLESRKTCYSEKEV